MTAAPVKRIEKNAKSPADFAAEIQPNAAANLHGHGSFIPIPGGGGRKIGTGDIGPGIGYAVDSGMHYPSGAGGKRNILTGKRQHTLMEDDGSKDGKVIPKNNGLTADDIAGAREH